MENEKDLAEIPDNVKKHLEILPMDEVSDVLKHALVSELVPIEWTDDSDVAVAGGDQPDTIEGVVTH